MAVLWLMLAMVAALCSQAPCSWPQMSPPGGQKLHFMGPVARKPPLLWPSVRWSQLEQRMQMFSALALVRRSPVLRARKVGQEARKVDIILDTGLEATLSHVFS